MTPDELGRLADRELALARSLAEDADRLRVEADAIRGAFEPLLAMSARVWTGPAAADFEARVRGHGHTLAEQAGHLQRIAAHFDGRAAELRTRASSLRSQATAARAAATMGASVVLPDGVN